ncbi:DUF6241 domain-containing protein [Niallia sp. HCP3S3_B10]|uniref:DUF6241 domain-containing protein n=1 Tax=Niallia sp. HCP3S3_B10 TaxID=3438944 RepID=UPI003F89B224
MKNKFAIIIFVSLVVVGTGVYFFSSNDTDFEVKPEPEKRMTVNSEKDDKSEEIDNNDSTTSTDPEADLELISEFPNNMKELEIQDAIHQMSHTKVYADEKWGSIEPTQGRIARLLEVIKENTDVYENSRLYLSILERWQENDFSNAVEDHNDIWNLQDGTIGKATRLLTEEEME